MTGMGDTTAEIRARLDDHDLGWVRLRSAVEAVLDRIDDYYAGKSTGAFAATLLADIADALGLVSS